MVLRFLARFFVGDDIFVSYSRADGGRYATILASELTKRKFFCRLDAYDTQPGREIPKSLRKALDRSFLLVVVGTPRAAESDHVTQEIAAFCSLRRNIVLLSFGGAHLRAKWSQLVEGLYPHPETDEHLSTGRPSTETIDLIEDSFRFRRRNQRLAITFWTVAAIIAGLVIYGSYLGAGLRTTRRELAETNTDLKTAGDQLESTRAELEKGKHDLLTVQTDLATSRADLKIQSAMTAHQSEIASARQAATDLVNRRDALSYTTPRDVVAAIRTADTLDHRGLEAEAYAVLNEHVAELPRLDASFQHERGVLQYQMMPGGQYFVTAGGDGTIRFWDYTTGRESGQPLRTGSVSKIVFSRDARSVVTAAAGYSVQLWDVASRTVEARNLGCPGPTGPIAVSAKGNLVAVACRNWMVIYG